MTFNNERQDYQYSVGDTVDFDKIIEYASQKTQEENEARRIELTHKNTFRIA